MPVSPGLSAAVAVAAAAAGGGGGGGGAGGGGGGTTAGGFAIFDTEYFPEIVDSGRRVLMLPPSSGGGGGGGDAAGGGGPGGGGDHHSTTQTSGGGGRGEKDASGAAGQHHSYYASPIIAINQSIRRKNVAAAAAAATSGPHLSVDAFALTDPWGYSSPDGGIGGGGGIGSGGFRERETILDRKYDGRIGLTALEKSRTYARPRQLSFSTTTACACNVSGGGGGSRLLVGGATPTSPLHASRSAAAVSTATGGETSYPYGNKACCPRCGKRIAVRPGDAEAVAAAATAAIAATSSSTTSTSEYLLLSGEPQHAQALLHSAPHLRFLSASSTDMQGVGNQPSGNPFAQLAKSWSAVVDAIQGDGVVPSSSRHGGSKHPLDVSRSHHAAGLGGGTGGSASAGNGVNEYHASLVRDRANRQAASELANLLWVLAHEMSLEDYGLVESEVFSAVFSLVHASDKERRMAGLAAVDALLGTPSADEEKKAIKFANTLATGLRAAHGDYEFLSAVSRALGKMSRRTANLDFVEAEVTRALEWLRTERSDRRYVNGSERE